MRKLSIGLIGLGIWGARILEELLFLKAKVHVFELRNKAAIDKLIAGVASYNTDFDSLMQHKMDGIIIASSTSSHAALLQQLAPFDIPLFVEKPLTNSFQDLLVIEQLNLKSTFVMHIWKYHPGVRLLADLARKGGLGEVKGAKSMRANWTSPRKDTDSLWNLAIHDLSICETILGFIPDKKQVVAERHNGILRSVTTLMGNEPFYNFDVSNRYPEKLREIRVFGTQGVAVLKDEKVDYVTLYKGDDTSELNQENTTVIPFDSTPPLRIELEVFLKYLEGGPPPPTDLAEGIRLIHHLVDIEKKCFETT